MTNDTESERDPHLESAIARARKAIHGCYGADMTEINVGIVAELLNAIEKDRAERSEAVPVSKSRFGELSAREALNRFLDTAASEGYVFAEIDAADLYVALFPDERERAAAIPAPPERSDVQGADERALFESHYFGDLPSSVPGRSRKGDNYVYGAVQSAWATWQAALASRPAVQQEGWVMVPVEPTAEMRKAAQATGAGAGWSAAYDAMIAAAPTGEKP